MSDRLDNIRPSPEKSLSAKSHVPIPIRSRPAAATASHQSTLPLSDATKSVSTYRQYAAAPAASADHAIIPPRGVEFLEAVDSEQLTHNHVLQWFIKQAGIHDDYDDDDEIFQIVNLGCSDGRVSFLLHKCLPDTLIIGLDYRQDRLALARRKRTEILKSENKWKERNQDEGVEVAEAGQGRLSFLRFDIHHKSPFLQEYGRILPPPDPAMKASCSGVAPLKGITHASNAVVCSLFLDNVALPKFFDVVTTLLTHGHGYLLVTNVHPAARRLAGFGKALVTRDQSGAPQSYLHTIEAIIEEAEKWGLVVIKQSDKKITKQDVKDLPEGCQAWVGTQCWFAIAFKLTR